MKTRLTIKLRVIIYKDQGEIKTRVTIKLKVTIKTRMTIRPC